MRICDVSDCKNKHFAKGYCMLHHKRWQRHGDPLINMGNIFLTDKNPNLAHGMTDTPEWISWKNMFDRCYNKNRPNYYKYGGKGITVCSSWKDFSNFYKDMGKRPQGTSLDRIDSSGNYEPSNCRWATPKIQARNSGRRKTA